MNTNFVPLYFIKFWQKPWTNPAKFSQLSYFQCPTCLTINCGSLQHLCTYIYAPTSHLSANHNPIVGLIFFFFFWNFFLWYKDFIEREKINIWDCSIKYPLSLNSVQKYVKSVKENFTILLTYRNYWDMGHSWVDCIR